MLTDSYVRLTMCDFANDREDSIRRASEVGVRFIPPVGIDLLSRQEAMTLCRETPSVCALSGAYSHHVKDME